MKGIGPLFFSLCSCLLAACGGGGGSEPAVPPESPTVTVTPAAASVMAMQQLQLAAIARDSMGNVLMGPVTWTSSNPAVATVDPTGLVTAVAPGQVTITATRAGQSASATLATTEAITFALVSAGSNQTCGLTADGTAYCWGGNSSGQLGNGTLGDSATPSIVSGELSFSALSAGGNQTCGLTSDGLTPGGVAYCWGDNSHGQLGNGSTTNSTAPTRVAGGISFDGLSVGANHVCGTSHGATFCWGDNTSGQLGDGTTTSRSSPVSVAWNVDSRITAGKNHTCGVIHIDGFLHIPVGICWGDNSSGELGSGTTTVPGGGFAEPLGTTVLMSAGALYTCALPEIGDDAMCWGNNSSGQLGNGTTTSTPAPSAVAGELSFTTLSAGAAHACGVSSSTSGAGASSAAYCWGGNAYGQLGNGTTSGSTVPGAVSGGLNFASISAGDSHTCGVTGIDPTGRIGAGAVYCWGDNTHGQLGNSWTAGSSVPVNVAELQ